MVSDISGILTAVTSQITIANVVALVASAIGAGITFVLAWFGVRKLIGVIMAAFKSGKLKV